MSNHIRIGIADEESIGAKQLHRIIQGFAGMEVIATAYYENRLFEELRFNQPDLLLLGVQTSQWNDREMVTKLRTKYPNMKIMLMGMPGDHEAIMQLLQAGAHGQLEKTADVTEIESAIRSIIARDNYASAGTALPYQQNSVDTGANTTLSNDEKEVLALLASNYSVDEISDRLYLSQPTVEKTLRKFI